MRRCSRFAEPRESRVAVQQYRAAKDSIAGWLDENTTLSGDAVVPQAELHAAYTSHCRRCGRRPASKQAFGRMLRALRPNIKPTQRTVARCRTWMYAGIALRGEAADEPWIHRAKPFIET